MNWKLRAARISKGWSIEKASEMVNVAARTYQRWERGTHVPNFDSRRLLREAFGMTDEELGYAADPLLSSLDNQHSVSLTDEELTTLSELFSLMRRSVMANFDPAKRETLRKLLRLLENAGITIGGFQLIDPEQIERLTGALRKASCIDAKTLSGLRNTTVNYWQIRRYGTVASPDLLNAAREHYRIVTQLLQGSLFPTTRTPLCAIMSETALLVGMLLSTDLQKHDEAWSYYETALEVAQQANNNALYAAALGRMGALAAATDKPKEACSLLQEAQRLVMRSDAFTLRAWLAAEEAEVQASITALGNGQDTTACFNALDVAERFANQIDSEEDTFGIYFDVARIPAYRGSCNIRLHHPTEALEALEEALEPLEPSGALTRAVLLDLAEASIQATAVEQAYNYITRALDITTQVQATSSLQRVHRLRQQLQPWAAVQAVKDLDEQLRRFKPDVRRGGR